MARGKKTGGKDFAVGNNANPIGGGAQDPNKRALRRMTQAQVAEVAATILSGTPEDLMRIVGDKDKGIPPDPTATPLKIWFARVALKGIGKGDMSSLDVLLNRTIGRVKEKIELTGEDGGPVQIVLTPEERKARIQELIDKAKS